VTTVLSRRALNRALLERQMLLGRRTASVDEALEHLVGMQAQAPLAPYVGLWSRLEGFRPNDLSELVVDRHAVRATAMLRGTIHLLTAQDALALRPVLQQVLERAFRSSPFAQNVDGLDLAEVLAVGREALEAHPQTVAVLARRLGEKWPDRDPASLSYAVRYLLPLVQIPPRGVWGATGQATLATLESWVGRPLATVADPDVFVLRYLAAYGPASVADIGTWSWLTGLREVVERLRPNLRTFRDDQGRELFDVPGGAQPDADVPAPVRFLPEYDNVLLSHSDRTRIVPRGRKVPLPPGNGADRHVLVDGFLRGRGGSTATVMPPDRGARQPVGRPGGSRRRRRAPPLRSADLRSRSCGLQIVQGR
jgi:hypothetical protein